MKKLSRLQVGILQGIMPKDLNKNQTVITLYKDGYIG